MAVTNDDAGAEQPTWSETVRNLPEVLTAAEAGLVLRMHHTTVRQLARQGKLSGASQIGKEWRFSKRALLRQLQVQLDEDSGSAEPSE